MSDDDDSPGQSAEGYDLQDHHAQDRNGGPNHLRAWMRYRRIKGSELAAAIGGKVTAGMISDLAASNRQLSAKWLRRLAPHLGTTPGLLLDHDPHDLDRDVLETWLNASGDQKAQIARVVAAIVLPGKTGTE